MRPSSPRLPSRRVSPGLRRTGFAVRPSLHSYVREQLLITDVVARWPGPTHDATIYQSSRRYSKFEMGDYRGNLLGDSGYPLKSHPLTPYLNPITRGQQKYNDAHIKTRNVVERQYGVLKRRFPVLAVGIRLRLETAIRVMLAYCVLHRVAQ
ncbi:hypothetical protein ACJJTC_019540 [Scirpophaga incertulas]